MNHHEFLCEHSRKAAIYVESNKKFLLERLRLNSFFLGEKCLMKKGQGNIVTSCCVTYSSKFLYHIWVEEC